MRQVYCALLWLVLAPAARAEDWLAVLPACALSERGNLPSFELLYPRPGLPAVVAAGDTLIARVRVPAPLTPPPGVQQPRALVGWHAALIGRALPWPQSDSVEQKHELAVIDVRPDSAQSLIYRAALPIPAWVAPGNYDLVLFAPSGSGNTPLGVRVLEPGGDARLGWVGGDRPTASDDALRALPIDVWVRGRGAEPRLAPSLEPAGVVAALRVGRSLWVIGSCHSSAFPFADEVRGVLTRERRDTFAPPAPPQTGFLGLDGQARAWPAADAFVLTRTADALRVKLAQDFPGPAELALLVADTGRAIEPYGVGAGLSFYPADDPFGRARGLHLALRVAPGADVRLTRKQAVALRGTLAARPRAARAGAAIRLTVNGLGPGARVAWRFDPLRTAFGSPEITTRFVELGRQRVRARALAADGRTLALTADVEVRTALASGCSCELASRSRPAPRLSSCLLWVALARLQRTSRRRETPARCHPKRHNKKAPPRMRWE